MEFKVTNRHLAVRRGHGENILSCSDHSGRHFSERQVMDSHEERCGTICVLRWGGALQSKSLEAGNYRNSNSLEENENAGL